MTNLSLYLLLDGTCKPAMEFYQSVFNGKLSITKVGDTSAKDQLPDSMHHKVIYARMESTNVDISASDWLRPDEIPVKGNTVCLYLHGGSYSELKSLFDNLAVGGNVTDPLRQEFFGSYGALNDKFGIRWMFHTNEK